jgi:hypothetical protein
LNGPFTQIYRKQLQLEAIAKLSQIETGQVSSFQNTVAPSSLSLGEKVDNEPEQEDKNAQAHNYKDTVTIRMLEQDDTGDDMFENDRLESM